MMYIQLRFETQGAEIVRQGLEDLTDEYLKVGRQRLWRSAQAMRRRIRKRNPAPIGAWAPLSTEQFRYVHFARERGLIKIPYVGSKRYADSWKIIRTEDGYLLQGGGVWVKGTGMAIDTPYGMYVGGDEQGMGQSSMHKGRWPIAYDVVQEELAKLPEVIQKDLAFTTRKSEFKWE